MADKQKLYAHESIVHDGVIYQRGDELPIGQDDKTLEQDLKDRRVAGTSKPKDDDDR